ncbi:MAG TPA: ribonuclease HII [Bacteroidales bacterium]|nr:ribonuclease HII [Bacteroidales bacterium]HQI70634.1 ribonuclease HII [Bacteroidales bacterium]
MLKSYFRKNTVEAGCDEAGRGCLAGPVFAAAVILPNDYKNKILNDSKQLSEKQREILRIEIEKEALAWAVAQLDNNRIDEINILNASIMSMHLAINKLSRMPELLLIDGNRFNPYEKIPHQCIVKGDGKYMSIAAASVLAKTHRDEFMITLHGEFPQYNWAQNKGYPTRDHKDAINLYGITPYHRKSFNLNEQLKLNF